MANAAQQQGGEWKGGCQAWRMGCSREAQHHHAALLAWHGMARRGYKHCTMQRGPGAPAVMVLSWGPCCSLPRAHLEARLCFCGGHRPGCDWFAFPQGTFSKGTRAAPGAGWGGTSAAAAPGRSWCLHMGHAHWPARTHGHARLPWGRSPAEGPQVPGARWQPSGCPWCSQQAAAARAASQILPCSSSAAPSAAGGAQLPAAAPATSLVAAPRRWH